MCSGLHGNKATRYLLKYLLHRFRCRRHFLFQKNFARFIQNAVVRPAIAEVQTNRELVSFENHVSIYANSASLLHSRSPFLCLEHVEHWERIASRGDRPSHPICPFRAFGPRNLMKMDRFLKPAKRGRSYFRLCEVLVFTNEFGNVSGRAPENRKSPRFVLSNCLTLG